MLLAGAALLTGCMSWETIPVSEAHEQLAADGVVQVTTRQQHVVSFVLVAVEGGDLVGKDLRVPLSDIALLQRRLFDFVDTVATGIGAVGTVFLVAATVGLAC